MLMVEFSIVPQGVSGSLAPAVARALQVVRESGLAHQTSPMGTVIEGSSAAVFATIQKCVDVLHLEYPRVTFTLRGDSKTGTECRMESKLTSLKKATAALGD